MKWPKPNSMLRVAFPCPKGVFVTRSDEFTEKYSASPHFPPRKGLNRAQRIAFRP